MREQLAFEQIVVTNRFLEVVAMCLGDRSHLEVSDAEVLPRIMQVIFIGKSHREAAGGRCTEELLLERHKEWAESGALPSFLLAEYPALYHRFHHDDEREAQP